MNRPDFNSFLAIYNDVDTYPTIGYVAAYFGVHKRTINKWIRTYKEEGNDILVRLVDRSRRTTVSQPKQVKSSELMPEDTTIINLKKTIEQQRIQLRSANQEIKQLQKDVLDADGVKEIIHATTNIDFKEQPKWLESTKKSKSKPHISGTPVLFLSDIHFDEVVHSAQINGSNSYNRDIAIERINNTFNTTEDLLLNHIQNPKYDGIVLCLGGDLFSGTIHEELAETNEYPILNSVVTLQTLLVEGIHKLKNSFKKVHVVAVVGNHGRMHKKPKMKNRAFDNYEWILYQGLITAFKGDANVTFNVPDGADALFSVYDTKFLLTHGDAGFNGGNGISGIYTRIMLGLHRKQARQAAIGQPFDVMMVGHYHQYVHAKTFIVNGSIKGYDEYAFINNYPYEDPQQSLFIVHPEFGITIRMPIICNKGAK